MVKTVKNLIFFYSFLGTMSAFKFKCQQCTYDTLQLTELKKHMIEEHSFSEKWTNWADFFQSSILWCSESNEGSNKI